MACTPTQLDAVQNNEYVIAHENATDAAVTLDSVSNATPVYTYETTVVVEPLDTLVNTTTVLVSSLGTVVDCNDYLQASCDEETLADGYYLDFPPDAWWQTWQEGPKPIPGCYLAHTSEGKCTQWDGFWSTATWPDSTGDDQLYWNPSWYQEPWFDGDNWHPGVYYPGYWTIYLMVFGDMGFDHAWIGDKMTGITPVGTYDAVVGNPYEWSTYEPATLTVTDCPA